MARYIISVLDYASNTVDIFPMMFDEYCTDSEGQIKLAIEARGHRFKDCYYLASTAEGFSLKMEI